MISPETGTLCSFPYRTTLCKETYAQGLGNSWAAVQTIFTALFGLTSILIWLVLLLECCATKTSTERQQAKRGIRAICFAILGANFVASFDILGFDGYFPIQAYLSVSCVSWTLLLSCNAAILLQWAIWIRKPQLVAIPTTVVHLLSASALCLHLLSFFQTPQTFHKMQTLATFFFIVATTLILIANFALLLVTRTKVRPVLHLEGPSPMQKRLRYILHRLAAQAFLALFSLIMFSLMLSIWQQEDQDNLDHSSWYVRYEDGQVYKTVLAQQFVLYFLTTVTALFLSRIRSELAHPPQSNPKAKAVAQEEPEEDSTFLLFPSTFLLEKLARKGQNDKKLAQLEFDDVIHTVEKRREFASYCKTVLGFPHCDLLDEIEAYEKFARTGNDDLAQQQAAFVIQHVRANKIHFSPSTLHELDVLQHQQASCRLSETTFSQLKLELFQILKKEIFPLFCATVTNT